MLAGLNDAKVAFLEEWGMGEREGERDREYGRERELGSHIGLGTKANGNRIPC